MDSVIQISIGGVIIGTVGIGILLIIASWLLKKWIGTRIEKSIQYIYDKQLEDYKFELLKKEQAAKAAELFSCWMKCDDTVLNEMTKEERRNHCERLNKLTWELAIWIPDEKIVKNIMNKLSHNSEQDIKEIILSVRQHLHRSQIKELKWENLVYFK